MIRNNDFDAKLFLDYFKKVILKMPVKSRSKCEEKSFYEYFKVVVQIKTVLNFVKSSSRSANKMSFSFGKIFQILIIVEIKVHFTSLSMLSRCSANRTFFKATTGKSLQVPNVSRLSARWCGTRNPIKMLF